MRIPPPQSSCDSLAPGPPQTAQPDQGSTDLVRRARVLSTTWCIEDHFDSVTELHFTNISAQQPSAGRQGTDRAGSSPFRSRPERRSLPGRTVRIVLVSMPWAIFNRPSIQLGTLKELSSQSLAATVTVETCHPYLEAAKCIGTDTYRALSENGWAGEALYAACFFLNRQIGPARFSSRSLGKKRVRDLPAFEPLPSRLDSQLDDWLAARTFADCSLVGFSVCFGQLPASLLAARTPEKNCIPNCPLSSAAQPVPRPLPPPCWRSFRRLTTSLPVKGNSRCWTFAGTWTVRQMIRGRSMHGDAPEWPARNSAAALRKSRRSSPISTRCLFPIMTIISRNCTIRAQLHTGPARGIFPGLLVEQMRLLQPQPAVVRIPVPKAAAACSVK